MIYDIICMCTQKIQCLLLFFFFSSLSHCLSFSKQSEKKKKRKKRNNTNFQSSFLVVFFFFLRPLLIIAQPNFPCFVLICLNLSLFSNNISRIKIFEYTFVPVSCKYVQMEVTEATGLSIAINAIKIAGKQEQMQFVKL